MISIAVLVTLVVFIIFTLGVISTALFNPDRLSSESSLIMGMQGCGVALVISYIIFRAMGGKLYKINLGGYADEDKMQDKKEKIVHLKDIMYVEDDEEDDY